MSSRVLVVGSGVLGFSVATVLRWAGHDVSLVGASSFTDEEATDNPLLASAYPAASIIPHSVNASSALELVHDSIQVFAKLRRDISSGVRLQRHFEISEGSLELPEYAQALTGFQACDPGQIPVCRKGATSLSGYSFSCYFCDMPKYGPWLVRLADRFGVRVQRREIDALWLREQKVDFIVNCLGAGAHRVFEDLEPGILFRGILLLAPLTTDYLNLVSYNYTPSIDVYPSGETGQAADVYFYPRDGHCVLGGTRQPGVLSRSGEFVSESHVNVDQIEVEGVHVPKPILELNRELIWQLTGKSIGDPYKALTGYRHVDVDPEGNERIALEVKHRKDLAPVIDCFGFGGAGVTLSWGAALQVARLVKSDLPQDTAGQLGKYLHQRVQH